MTSNLGSAYLTENIRQDGTIDPTVKEQVEEELKRHFRPEFINRIDDIVVFSPLTEEQIHSIIDLSLKSLSARLADRNITLHLTDAAKSYIAGEALRSALRSETCQALSPEICGDGAGGDAHPRRLQRRRPL